jgi:hypothetical protein
MGESKKGTSEKGNFFNTPLKFFFFLETSATKIEACSEAFWEPAVCVFFGGPLFGGNSVSFLLNFFLILEERNSRQSYH